MGAATFNRDPDVIKALIAAGADVNARHESKWDMFIYPLLHLMTLKDTKASMRKLLKLMRRRRRFDTADGCSKSE